MKHFSLLITVSIFSLFLAFPAFAYIGPDTFPPTVGDVTANVDQPPAGTYVTYSVTATDNIGIASCQLFLDDAEVGDMAALGTGPYQLSYRWPWSASSTDHSAFARCVDAAGNYKSSAGTKYFTVTPGTDTTNPVVGAVTPRNAVAGVPVTFSATYSDSQSGVVQCVLYRNGTRLWTSATWAPSPSGTASITETLSAGMNNLTMLCIDAAGNNGSGMQTDVTVAASGDTTPPSVGNVFASIDEPHAGTEVTYYVNANDNVGIANCHLFIDNADGGSMPLASSGSYALNYTWPVSSVDTTHSAQARCSDAAGNSATSTGVKLFHVTPTVVSSNVSAIKSTIAANPVSTIADGSHNVTVIVKVMNDSGTVLPGKTVSLSTTGLVAGVHISTPTITSQQGEATFDVQSAVAGYAKLVATVDNVVIVQQPVLTFTAASCPLPTGRLVKLQDDRDPKTTEDTAVYYYGNDCKRHAFPNEHVYMTWYSNFNSVVSISPSEMASMPLGNNATYHPGVRMVKFTTVPKVYAVSKGGVLRWVPTEAIATQLYGTAWNKYIDDIADAFYGNYKFGNDIASSSDFNPANETFMAPTVDSSM